MYVHFDLVGYLFNHLFIYFRMKFEQNVIKSSFILGWATVNANVHYTTCDVWYMCILRDLCILSIVPKITIFSIENQGLTCLHESSERTQTDMLADKCLKDFSWKHIWRVISTDGRIQLYFFPQKKCFVVKIIWTKSKMSYEMECACSPAIKINP